MDKGLSEFVLYCQKHLKGDEKGESQIFLDRFFVALGFPEGVKGAGAECEFRLRDEHKKTTSFGDLVWSKRVLIEMKKAEEDLSLHIQQAQSYWLKLAADRPKYVILCNFWEFWIYDFDKSIYEPVEKVPLALLPEKKSVLGFLLPKPIAPIFRKDREDVTAKAADKVSSLFKSMVKRNVNREDALRYCLQCIVAMFAEDVELLPDKIFSRLVQECQEKKVSSYDLIGGLFREMNTEGLTPAGRYKDVDYFNGGLFEKILHIELTEHEINLLDFSAMHNWKNVNPAIFGSIFEGSLELEERHKLGAHYTHEIDIKKIVDPVIVQPWTEKLETAETLDELYDLLRQLKEYKVLDPACGSGNFLFVAFKELKIMEKRILSTIRELTKSKEEGRRLVQFLSEYEFVNTAQFYGLDIKPFAVELAKVTLMVAKEISWLETKEDFDNKSKPLPLDNLDENILCKDALLNMDGTVYQWPFVDAIIGNPPYQSKNKMQQEFGAEYLNRLRAAYPEVPGRADFCVYWYYKAHQSLKDDAYAGLVGTNTIRQNYSREGSLDYIVKHGGTIFNAVSTEDWQGEAAVHVSIANWKKGVYEGPKILYVPNAKDELLRYELPYINSSLSFQIDVTSAKVLNCNKIPKTCFQGQTHGHEGFLLSIKEAQTLIKKNPKYQEVLKPFLIGQELVGNFGAQPSRFVIDFTGMDINEASSYKEVFAIIKEKVLPDREARAKEQEVENRNAIQVNPKAKVNKHHLNFYNRWWHLSYGREDMVESVSGLKRYVSCSRVSLRPIFEFVSNDIRPSDVVMVFLMEDDYSFGIINSNYHWLWYIEKCSTLGNQYRYTTDSIWDTFPWPQTPSFKQVEKVAQASKALREARKKAMQGHRLSLRDLYRLLEEPGKNPIKDLHISLDKAVLEAFGFIEGEDILSQLLELNLATSKREEEGEVVQGPGLPSFITDKTRFVSEDCVKFEW